MKTDRTIGRGLSVCSYRHPLLSNINLYLGCLKDLQDSSARRWTPHAAAVAAVLMSLDATHPLFVRLGNAQACMESDFSGRRRTGKTYNGLIKALTRQAPRVLPAIKKHLRQKVLESFRRIPRTCGWRLLAVDGTKEQLPRTVSHEAFFGIADNGKFPQALVTAVVEVHTGLLWDWRIDRGCGSEKGHLEEMGPTLPEDVLLLADGNFVGYNIWSALVDAGKWFLIRVGGNVDLLTDLFPDTVLERQGNIVYAWPKARQRRCPPLRLRLIRGSESVHLLTNVLDESRLSQESAAILYRLRWGAEIFYRTFKRTMDLARLKSRSGARASLELEWALITCCILSLLGTQALHQSGKDPRRLSPARLMHACRDALFHGTSVRIRTGDPFQRALAQAVRDSYVRHGSKKSRHRPITKNTPKSHQLKPPNLRPATRSERTLAQEQQKLAA